LLTQLVAHLVIHSLKGKPPRIAIHNAGARRQAK
jgi:hypothetical protein